ncbi:MAG TPA: hypothetical protein DCQ26_11320 [Marinilabiliales bacterium]|jgi:uncharacterized protein with NRDE domain|nr:MAG: hypothetical protein A2W95_15415 [Bacteroidetes bacterium GWA2_40_14]OFX64486.1 MAG: hypothetical protein A2W84_18780 [Bacteroidetes bacterium GWC2_40_13]OFX71143.1 MAG: hypothetical protein A2W96_15510 [Bacteroidetes bacterium GWD2_40_43]OFX92374.1 MAG: hypothetical protein A2W97_10445 [Bacteroidetes bacterium GWE2_40_63]OFY22976.1 MAG: hypothetical protein A2W88_04430 [Bacteroidetes bacterium GWF2_40_13]OFZ29933.1 MAG: hypothetical protein A2437_00540 [Bacteroidetes bacterium RIFOXYC
MCTVTYIPHLRDNPFVLTSNRDEKVLRPTIPPAIYHHGSFEVAYPKDEKAGGSWIAMNNTGNVNCLLNGGFIPHKKQELHTISRGIILLEFTSSGLSAHEFFAPKVLANVEPFTIVAVKHINGNIGDLTEFIWDGNDKYFRQMDKSSPHIWSSVTLYNDEHRKMRKEWFEKFYKEDRDNMTTEKILDFHSGTHSKDNSINVIMYRDGGLKTVSITQVSVSDGQSKMSYSDLLNGSIKKIQL